MLLRVLPCRRAARTAWPVKLDVVSAPGLILCYTGVRRPRSNAVQHCCWQNAIPTAQCCSLTLNAHCSHDRAAGSEHADAILSQRHRVYLV